MPNPQRFEQWWATQKASHTGHGQLDIALRQFAEAAWNAAQRAVEDRIDPNGNSLLHLLEQLISGNSSKDILLCHDYQDGFWVRAVDKGELCSGAVMDRADGRLRLTLAEAIREAVRYDNAEWERIFHRPSTRPTSSSRKI